MFFAFAAAEDRDVEFYRAHKALVTYKKRAVPLYAERWLLEKPFDPVLVYFFELMSPDFLMARSRRQVKYTAIR